MCTYSRNKDANLIEGVENLCRLCLRDLVDPVHVFNKENDLCSFLSFRIMLSAGVQFSYEKNLPNAICKQCHEQVEGAYIFRKLCQSSYRKIRSHLQAFKCKNSAELQNNTAKNFKAENDTAENFKAENSTTENFKTENNMEEGKLVLNFEKDEVAEIQDNSQVPVEICNENNLEGCESSKAVIGEKIKTLQTLKENSLENCGESASHYVQDNDCKLVVEEKVEVEQQLDEEEDENVVPAVCRLVQVTESVPVDPPEDDEEDVEDARPNLDIATFLSTILTELEVLRNYGECLELTDYGSISLELEMNDDNLINLEIVEEDPVTEETPVVEFKPVHENVPESEAEQNVVIQYVTRNRANKNVRLADGGEITALEEKHEEKMNIDDPRRLVVGKEEEGDRLKVMCPECRKLFVSRGSLRRHQRLHSGERPHACKVCGRRFTQRAVLKRHRLTHLETRPFQCDACEKSFTQRSGLAAHARTHRPPNKRPLHLHACPLCNKVFLYPSGLSRHMTTHDGRVYMCAACAKTFRDKSSLLRHLRTCKQQPERTLAAR